MVVSEKEITVRLRPDPYQRLQAWARQAGKTPESLTREIIERAVEDAPISEHDAPQTPRQILEAAGRIAMLSPALKAKIIPGVELEDVRAAVAQAGGPSLSEILLRQRDPRL
jgi:hypothetical protein